jgi:membrane protein
MFPLTSLRILWHACEKWVENGGTRQSAALAYYTLFSIAPLLLIAEDIAGAVFGEEAAHGQLRQRMNAIMGAEIAAAVEKMVQSAAQSSSTSGWVPYLSIGLLVIGALGAFLHVRSALCLIWHLEPPSRNTWLSLLLDYLIALLMVLSIAVLLLLSVAASLVVPIVRKHFSEDAHWQWVELAGSFLFLAILFATSYRVLSGWRLPWGYVWYGAAVTSILFSVGKMLLSYYLVFSGTESAYGAAGSVVVFLVWVYYSSLILFFGAELIQARRTRAEWMKPLAA